LGDQKINFFDALSKYERMRLGKPYFALP
jgi:hypothetical protein